MQAADQRPTADTYAERIALGHAPTRSATHRDPPFRVLVVGAHADDETIGIASRLPHIRDAWILTVTDGGPRDGKDARAKGFAGREDYASARAIELRNAMAVCGVTANRVLNFGVADQGVPHQLVQLTRRMQAYVQELEPDVVVTHPYEGGHPDHDSVALIVHAAVALARRAGQAAPAIVEMTSYHAPQPGGSSDGKGEFLAHEPAIHEHVVKFTAGDVELKRRAFGCFTSQQDVVDSFPLVDERFRAAPAYDFRLPPHQGQLNYEAWHWSMTGEHWRTLAAAALDELDLQGQI